MKATQDKGFTFIVSANEFVHHDEKRANRQDGF
jgi:hypothetical protein